MDFALAPRTDIPKLAASFRRDGFVVIEGLLPEAQAEALTASLNGDDGWVEVLNAGERVYEIALRDFRELPAETARALHRKLSDAARQGFQFHFRTIRVADEEDARRARGLMLDRFALFMNSAAVLDLLKAVTGMDAVRFLDAQATVYGAGHFLGVHDDDVAGKNRLAAYVLGLTHHWPADWGGLLLFPEGEEVRGFVPAFNALRLFAVPRAHFVSQVASWVDAQRLSITGWLRSAGP